MTSQQFREVLDAREAATCGRLPGKLYVQELDRFYECYFERIDHECAARREQVQHSAIGLHTVQPLTTYAYDATGDACSTCSWHCCTMQMEFAEQEAGVTGRIARVPLRPGHELIREVAAMERKVHNGRINISKYHAIATELDTVLRRSVLVGAAPFLCS